MYTRVTLIFALSPRKIWNLYPFFIPFKSYDYKCLVLGKYSKMWGKFQHREIRCFLIIYITRILAKIKSLLSSLRSHSKSREMSQLVNTVTAQTGNLSYILKTHSVEKKIVLCFYTRAIVYAYIYKHTHTPQMLWQL